MYDAVFAFAHALTALQADTCDSPSDGLCEGMQPERTDGTVLLSYLERVEFTGTSCPRNESHETKLQIWPSGLHRVLY